MVLRLRGCNLVCIDSSALQQTFDQSTQGKVVPLNDSLNWPTLALPLKEKMQGFSALFRLGAGK